jgi:GT2 family glycosyltransferase
MTKRVTVLILSVDEAPMLSRSLPAAVDAAAAAPGAQARVVVVDNAGTDGTAALAARHGAELVRLPSRVGYASAINAGLDRALADSDAILLLNADCFVDPEFLAAALPRLDDPSVGSVAPKLLRAAFDQASDTIRPLDQIDAAGMWIDRRRKNGLVGHGEPAAARAAAGEVFGADGAAALYRAQTLRECALAGGEVLDEDMELWATDADLAWRARLYGWRSVYEPSARAHHIRTYSPSTRARLPAGARRVQFRNRLLMIVKNETLAGLARDWPWIAGYEVLALGYALLRERELLRGYAEAARLLRGTLRRRRIVQARRRVTRTPIGLPR